MFRVLGSKIIYMYTFLDQHFNTSAQLEDMSSEYYYVWSVMWLCTCGC